MALSGASSEQGEAIPTSFWSSAPEMCRVLPGGGGVQAPRKRGGRGCGGGAPEQVPAALAWVPPLVGETGDRAGCPGEARAQVREPAWPPSAPSSVLGAREGWPGGVCSQEASGLPLLLPTSGRAQGRAGRGVPGDGGVVGEGARHSETTCPLLGVPSTQTRRLVDFGGVTYSQKWRRGICQNPEWVGAVSMWRFFRQNTLGKCPHFLFWCQRR